VFSAPSSPITITGLAAQAYTVYVRAVSATGPWTSTSNSSGPYTPQYAGTVTVSAVTNTSQLNALDLTFTTPVPGNPVPNTYAYSVNGGSTYANTTLTSLTVTGVPSAQATVVARSANIGIWMSPVSNSVTVSPYYQGSVSVAVAIPANYALNTLSLTFTTPVVGNPAPNVYYYSVDGGASFGNSSLLTTATATGLPSAPISVVARSANIGIWTSPSSSTVTLTPYYAGGAPTMGNVYYAPGSPTVTFNNPYTTIVASVSNSGNYNTACSDYAPTGNQLIIFANSAGVYFIRYVNGSMVGSSVTAITPLYPVIAPAVSSSVISCAITADGKRVIIAAGSFQQQNNKIFWADSSGVLNGTSTFLSFYPISDSNYRFYTSMAVSADGSRLVTCTSGVSDNLADRIGVVYVSSWNSGSSNYGALTAVASPSGYNFYGIDISRDGSRIVYSSNATYLFWSDWNGTTFDVHTGFPAALGNSGRSVSFLSNDTSAIISTPYTFGGNGSNQYFVWTGSSYGAGTTVSTTYVPTSTNIGWGLAVDNAGNLFYWPYNSNSIYRTPGIVVSATGTPVPTITFTPGSAGNPAATAYYYTVDASTNYVNLNSLTSPAVLPNFPSGSHLVRLKANATVNGTTVWSTADVTYNYVVVNAGSTPTIASVVPTLNAFDITLNPSTNGSPDVTNYLIAYDSSFTTVEANLVAPSVGPTTISAPLNQSYTIYAKAIGGSDWSSAYDSSAATPFYAGTASVAAVPVVASLNSLQLTFTTPAAGNPLANVYSYSTDGGFTYVSGSSGVVTVDNFPSFQASTVYATVGNGSIWTSAPVSTAATPYYTSTDPSINSVDSSLNKLVVQFSGPTTDGNPATTTYLFAVDASAAANFTYSATTSPVTITGLSTKGTRTIYMKTVGNLTGTATTVWTSNIVSSMGQPYVTGTAPTVSSIQPGLNTLTVNWNASTDGFPDPTNYVLSYSSAFTTEEANIAMPADLSATLVAPLNESYTVYVKALGGDVWTSAAGSLSGTPYYEGNVVVVAAPVVSTLNALQLTFTSPNPGNPPATNYSYSTDGGATYTSTASTSVTATGLPSALCTVYANVNSGSTWASTTPYITSATPYYQGSDPTLSAPLVSGIDKLTVAYTASSGGNPVASNYYYAVDVPTAWVPAPATSPFDITSLAGGSRTVYFKAEGNLAGTGTTVWSSAVDSSAGYVYAIGSTPTIQSVTPGLYALTVRFVPSTGSFPDLSGYQYAFVNADASFANVPSLVDGNTFTLTGLANQPYTIYVRGYNSVWTTAVSASAATTPYYEGTAGLTATVPANNALQTIQLDFTSTGGNPQGTRFFYSSDGGITYANTTSATALVTNLSLKEAYTFTMYVQSASAEWTSTAVTATTTPYYAGNTTVTAVPIVGNTNALDVTLGGTDGNPTRTTYSYSTDGITFTDTVNTSFRLTSLENRAYTIYANSRSGSIWTSTTTNVVATPYYAATAATINSVTTVQGVYSVGFTNNVVVASNSNTQNYNTAASDYAPSGTQLFVFANDAGLLHMRIQNANFTGATIAATTTTFDVTPPSGTTKTMACAITSDGKRVVVATGSFQGGNGYLYWGDCTNLFNGTSTAIAFTRILDSTQRSYNAIAMTPNGARLVAVSAPGTVQVSTWNGTNYTELTNTLDTTSRNYYGVAMTRDGLRIACTTDGNFIYWADWNGSTYNAFTTVTYNPGNGGRSIVFPDGTKNAIVTVPYGNQREYVVWDGTTGSYGSATSISTTYIPAEANIGWGTFADSAGYLYTWQYASNNLNRTQVTVTQAPSTTTVAFTPGTAGNPPAFAYYYWLDSSASYFNTGSLSPSFTISGVSPGNHQIAVKSSAFWESPDSNVYNFAITATGSTPTVASVVVGINQLDITVNPSTGGTPEVTNYLFAFNASFVPVQANVVAPNVTATFAGLADQSYNVFVKAIGGNVWTSGTDNVTATPYYRGNVVVVASPSVGNLNALRLSFTSPYVGNPPTTDFLYSVNNELPETSLAAVNAAAETYVFNLPSAATATVRANAKSGTTWSTLAPVVVSATPYHKPPTDLSINGIDSSFNALVVRFTVPATDGHPATSRYVASLDASNYLYSTTTSPLVIRNLTTSGERTVSLKAIGNLTGTSTTVWTSNVAVATGQPYVTGNVPTFYTVVPQLNAFAVTLNASTGGYPPPTHYLIAYDSLFTDVQANLATPTSGSITATLSAPLDQPYALYAKAIGGNVWTSSIDSSSATPFYRGNVVVVATPSLGNLNTLRLSFTSPYVGNPAITNFLYSVNNVLPETSLAATNAAAETYVTGLPNALCTVRGNGQSGSEWSTVEPYVVTSTPYYTGTDPVWASVSSGIGQLTVSYTASTGGNPEVTQHFYAVDASLTPGAWTLAPSSPTTTFDITGLAGGNHTLYLQSFGNLNGGSGSSGSSTVVWSSAVDTSAGYVYIVGSVPTIQRVVSVLNALTITFEPSVNGFPAVTDADYEYAFTNVDGSFVSVPTPLVNGNTFTISGLTDASYNVYLRAVGKTDNGTTRAWVSAADASLGRPYLTPTAGPQNIDVDSSLNALVVYFTKEPGGYPDATTYYYWLDGSFVDAGVATSPVVIGNLNAPVQHHIALKAVFLDSNGEMVWESPVSSTSNGEPYIDPIAGPSITAVDSSLNGLVVHFTREVGGFPLASFYAFSVDGGNTFTESVTTTASPLVIGNLTTAGARDVVLRAIFNDPSSGLRVWDADSPTAVSGQPYVRPNVAPVLQSLTSQVNALSVSFLPPTGGYPNPTTYLYRLDGSNNGLVDANTTASPFTISGLGQPVAHTVSVVARFVDPSSGDVVWTTEDSNPETQYPYVAPSVAPHIDQVVSDLNQVLVYFTDSSGSYPPLPNKYFVSVDDGATFNEVVGSFASPIAVPLTDVAPPDGYLVRLYGQFVDPQTSQAQWDSSNSNAVAGFPYIQPTAPSNVVVDSSFQRLVVNFVPPANGYPEQPTAYYCGVDGVFFRAAETASPIVVANLFTAAARTITLYAVFEQSGNTVWTTDVSPITSTSIQTPYIIGSAPVINTLLTESAFNALRVYFAPTTDGYPAPLRYYYTLDAGNTFVAAATTTSPIDVSGLTVATTYTVQLQADNGIGNTALSNSTSGIPWVIGSKPTIRAITSAPNSLQVAFDDSSGGYPAPSAYYYTVNSTDPNARVLAAETQSPITVTAGLTAAVDYTIRIAAFNAAGYTELSDPSAGKPYVTGAPPVITNVSGGVEKLIVSVNPPVGCYPDPFTYYYSLDNVDFFDANTAVSPIEVPTPKQATTFAVYLMARNLAGNTAVSDPAYGTPLIVGAPPVINSVTTPALNVLRVAFNLNNSSGTANDTLYYSVDGANTFASTSSIQSPLDISGLFVAKDYGVVIKAGSAAGNTELSNQVHKVPLVIGSAPQIQAITPGLQRLTVAFGPSTDGNPNPTTYYYSLDNGNTNVNAETASSPLVIQSGVNDAVTYTVRIRGYNATTGFTPLSDASFAMPYVLGQAPVITAVDPSLQRLVVAFDPPVNGNPPPTTYYYSLDGGNQYVDANTTVSPLTVSGLTVTTAYTVQLQAFHPLLGNTQPFTFGTAVAPFNVGTTPVISRITSALQSLVVEFTDSTNGNPTPYVYVSTDGGNTFANSHATVSPITIAGLTENRFYDVQLQAVNAVGNSAASATVSGRPWIVGNAAVITQVESRLQSIAVYFTGSTDGYPTPTTYWVSLDNGNTFTDAAATASPIIIHGLTQVARYDVVLKAQNAAGNTAPSNTVVGEPYIVGSEPTIASVDSSYNALLVHFALSSGGFPSFPQRYLYSLDNGVSFVDAGNVASSPLVIAGLTSPQSYTVQLQAEYVGGNTSVSTGPAQTPYVIGSVPTIVAPIVSQRNALSVAFNPSTNGFPAPFVYYSVDGGNTFANAETNTSPLTVTGLTGLAPYSVVLKAVYGPAGNTAASAAVAGQPYVVPSAPTITQVDSSNEAVIVSFTQPEDGYPSPTTYYYSKDGGINFLDGGVAASPLVVRGLTQHAVYSFSLYAVTAGGDTAVSNTVSGEPWIVGSMPSIAQIDASLQALVVRYNPSLNGYPAPSAYYYSLDSTSPSDFQRATLWDASNNRFTIAGLLVSRPYAVRIFAQNAAGNTAASPSLSGTPYSFGNAPVITQIDSVLQGVVVNYQPTVGGTPAPVHYYSVDGGSYVPVNGSALSATQFAIAGLMLPKTYAVRVIAVSSAGELVSNTASGEPWIVGSVPTILQVDSSDQALVVSFAPSTGGQPATPTSYEYTVDGGATFANTQTLSSPFVIASLSLGTYDVQLRAVYPGGATAASASVQGQPYVVGSAPVIDAVDSADQALVVRFSETTDSYPLPDTYYYTLDGGNTFADAATTTSPFVIGGLTTATERTVQLVAHNPALGNTATSNAVAGTPWVVGSAPVLGNVSSQLNALVVSFAASTGGNPAPAGYQYTLDGGNTFADAGVLQSPFVVSNLTVLQVYTVQLRAAYLTGNTAASNAVVARPWILGSAPTITQVRGAFQSVEVEFTPSQGGNPLPATYFYSVDGGASFQDAGTTASPLVLGGYTAPATLQIQLYAASEAGNSPVSNTVVGEPWVVGTAPNISRIDSSNQSLVVTFRGPQNGFPAPTTYFVSTDNGNTYVEAGNISSPYTVPGLAVAKDYFVRLIARNAAGNTAPSAAVTGQPFVIGTPPVLANTSSGLQSLTVFFEPTQNANPAVTTYYYSVNGGAYINAQRATSPITVSSLTTAGTYSIALFGASAFGNTQVSNTVFGEPWIVGTAPQITTLTPYLQGVSVAFAPSAGGHPAPQTYYFSVDGGNTYVDAQTTVSPLAIGNLVAAAPYAFALKAYNDTVGFTANSAVKTATPWVVGGAPVVSNVASAVNALVVSFVGSTAGNPPPTTYSYTLDNGITYVNMNTTVSPFTIGNLTTVGPRTVQLVATNAAGTTAPSNAVSGQPFVRGDRPVITRIQSGYQSLSIEFDASGGYNGYPALTTYFYSLDDGATYTNAQTTQSPIAVSNLFLPLPYTVRLMGYNAAVGNTQPSLAVVATPYIISSAPNEVSVTPALESLVIEIDPATDGYPAAYTYKYSLDGVAYTDLQSNSTTITVPQLTELRRYTVSIVAVNNAGTSSPLVVQGTPYIVGSAPTVASVQDVPNGIVVQFAPSTGGNPSPSTYYYSLNGGTSYVNANTAVSPLVVTGLLPAPYAFRLKGFSPATGFTPASSPAVFGNVSGVGSAPVITSITGVQNGLIVNFQPSLGGNPPPTTYYYSLDGGEFVDGHIPGSPLIITGLNVIKSYAVQVFAASEVGNTAASPVEYGMPFLVGGPPSITGLVVDENALTLTVNFLESGGNPPPVAYEYSLDSGATYVNGNTAHSPIVIQNIDLFGSYTVTVRAIYASPPSQSASWTSNRVEPAPLVLSVTADFNVLTVALQRPDPAHYPALEAYYYSLDGGATYVSAGTNQSPITVTGLDSGTTYTVLIRGKNVFGLDTEAAAITSTTRSVANFFVNAMNPAGNRRRPIFVGPQPKFTVLPTGNNNNAKNTSQKYSDYVNGPHATRR
jgi:hypothetical protein